MNARLSRLPMIALLGAATCATSCAPQTDQTAAAPPMRWKEESGTTDLYDGDRRVIQFMHAYDDSTPETLHETYKCYHHVYDETGERSLTKGSGGLYTHHRGIFIGWNRLTLEGREYDFWHMKEVTQRLTETVTLEADDTSARQVVMINWCDPNGELVISERRQITVRRTAEPALLLLDFESQLTALAGDLLLNGDPEHAGFQFRAHNDVADGEADVKAAYLFHADDIDPTEDLNLPWVAMTVGLYGNQYSVQHINHPDNPHPTIYSAYRDYGRFGAFPKVEIAKGETLTLLYRIWVTAGDLPPRDVLQARYDEYVD